jgi:ElaB/YqjD/DUF883 family membrane-anchored ribosome-binding protein
MSSIVEVLNNHINSRFSYNKEKESYIDESIKGKLLGTLASAGAGAYALHKLTGGEDDGDHHDDHEGGIWSGIKHNVQYALGRAVGNTHMQTDAASKIEHENQARFQRLANQHEQDSKNLNDALHPQASTALQSQAPTAHPQTQSPTATQPQSQSTTPQSSANQDESHAASAIKNVGLATSQFVQQNPLAAGAIGTAGAIGAGIMAKRAMQNSRQ